MLHMLDIGKSIARLSLYTPSYFSGSQAKSFKLNQNLDTQNEYINIIRTP